MHRAAGSLQNQTKRYTTEMHKLQHSSRLTLTDMAAGTLHTILALLKPDEAPSRHHHEGFMSAPNLDPTKAVGLPIPTDLTRRWATSYEWHVNSMSS